MSHTQHHLSYLALIAAINFLLSPTAEAQGYEMHTTRTEVPGTREIEDGRPRDAIRIASRYINHVRGADKVAVLTNLCIGHVMTGELERAEPYCEAAAAKPNERSVTQNNRGVLRALQGNLDAARDDFQLAANLSCEPDCAALAADDRDLPAHIARRNLRKTEARMVEVAATPTSERLTARDNR